MKCNRSRCQKKITGIYTKVFNDPSTVEGYKIYCINCGYGISQWNPGLTTIKCYPDGEEVDITYNIEETQ